MPPAAISLRSRLDRGAGLEHDRYVSEPALPVLLHVGQKKATQPTQLIVYSIAVAAMVV
jgi:hypothetical protein